MPADTPTTSPTYDEGAWPILVVTLPAAAHTPLTMERHLERLSSYYLRNRPFGLVVDIRRAPTLPADARRRVAEQMDCDTLRYPNLLRGSAIVLSSKVQRGVVNVIAWLSMRPIPLEAFTSIEDAKTWLHKKLA